MIKPVAKSKLTLWVPRDVKEFGRRWSRRHGESLSGLFSDFLIRLRQGEEPSKIPAIIRRMTGVVKGLKNPKAIYHKQWEEKYL